MKRLWATGALRAKAELAAAPLRRTTSEIDRLLGFSEFVHLYLPTQGYAPADLPIIRAQLGPSPATPVAHVVLKIDTAPLNDAQCGICNWNIAVGHPAVPGVGAGMWPRGVDPLRVAEVWDLFRETQPDRERARGFFHDGVRVPCLFGTEIAENLDLIKGATPELLVRKQVSLGLVRSVIVFSDHDRRSLELLSTLRCDVELVEFPGYAVTADPVGPRRKLIDDYFCGTAPEPRFDFDAVRPRARP